MSPRFKTISDLKKGVLINWNSTLYNAALRGDLDYVKQALENGANSEGRAFIDFRTILIECINRHPDFRNFEIVETLVESGADVNAVEKRGMNPLAFAISRNDRNIVKLLLKKGARLPLDFSGGEELKILIEQIWRFINKEKGFFPDEEIYIFRVWTKPEKIEFSEKGKVAGVLRKIVKEKRIDKGEAYEKMKELQGMWNEKTGELQKVKMRGPLKREGKNLRRVIN